MSFYYNITEHFHFRECAFLQSSDDVANFEAEIQKCGSNDTYLDQAVSNYDFTDKNLRSNLDPVIQGLF